MSKVFAIFTTNMGNFKCELYPEYAPKTVENFIGLAKGTKQWQNPKTGEKEQKPFYDGLIFHRVISDFMIQGGCPLGMGTGGPGYKFEDEFTPKLRHDKKGCLSMANAGPNTNGSQFFITVVPTPWLDDHHTIFGQVVEDMEVVNAISVTQIGANNRPINPVIINSISIEKE